jgi:hypothetical protein
VIDLTLADPPGETTHWSVRAMAKAAGVGAVRPLGRVLST